MLRCLTITIALVTFSSGVASAAMTCTEATARCVASAGAGKPQIAGACQDAGAACKKSGNFVGPASGTMWRNLRRE